MKHILLALVFVPFLSSAQIGYTVKVTKLMATADDCDGGGFCLSAPQDPVFNIWVTDAEANENTNCWTFDNDDDMEYGEWNDITDFELANEAYVTTNYLSFDMAAFESDAVSGISCSSGFGDDNVFDRTFIKLITTASMPVNTPYIDTISIGNTFFMEVEIFWTNYLGLDELNNDFAVAISPNPSNGVFKINMTESDVNDFQIIVQDITGTIVYNEMILSKELNLDLSQHKPGAYFVKVITADKSVTKRILIQQ